MYAVTAGMASFIFIFLKAFQQRNVVLDTHWLAVVLTSLCMAVVEVYVIALVVRNGYDPVLVGAVGTGSGLGAVAARATHKYLFRSGVA